ncbi:phage portal protein [Escherichia coli]|nr:phage portal protein [Escherichia coli]
MRLTAVFSCVRVLAESVGMLPCNLYHLNGSLKQRATGERLHKLISTHPNGYMTPQEFWELVVTCLCLRGNFYAYKVKAFGEVAELLPVDPGCVVPGDDSPGENKSQTDYWQELKEGFSVVVILSNGRDERGQFASYDVVDDVRQMLFKALLGWNPEACGNPITYDGGTLLDLNRHELIYQFDFSVISELTEDDTRQQDDLNSLDELQTLAIDVDYLDPGNGPDGDIEHHTEITLPS